MERARRSSRHRARLTTATAIVLMTLGVPHTAPGRHVPDSPIPTPTSLQEQAEALRRQWTRASFEAAIAKYTLAEARWHRAGDARGEAESAVNRAEIYETAGRTRQARAVYEHARRRAVAAADGALETRSLNGIARADLFLGDRAAAVAHGRRALERSRETHACSGEAEALNVLGDTESHVGRTRDALPLYDDALTAADRCGDVDQRAHALLNIGYSRSDLGEIEDAEVAYNQALSLWTANGNRRQAAITENGLGHLYSKRGARQRALASYRRAGDLFESIGDDIYLGVTMSGLGYLFIELGEPQIARGYYQRQLEAQRRAAFRHGEAGALGGIGYCEFLIGNTADALIYFGRSLEIARSLDDRKGEAFTRGLVGLVYEARGELTDALRSHEQSLALTRTIGDKREEAYALTGIGRVLNRLGRRGEAIDRLARARTLSGEAANRGGESLALYDLALVEQDLDRLPTALAHIRESLQLSERLRDDLASLDLRSSFFADLRSRHELLVTLLMRLHEGNPLQGFDVQAFEAAESARARSLLDGLTDARSGIRGGADQALLDRQRVLSRRLDDAAARLARLKIERAPDAEIAAATTTLDVLGAERAIVDGEIRARSPRFAALTRPRTLTLREVQSSILDGDSVLLQYFVGTQASYVWAVTNSSVRVHALPGRAHLEPAVRALRQQFETMAPRQPDVAVAAPPRALPADVVSDLVLRPVAAALSASRLLIVPDGVLNVVPFAALSTPGSPASHPTPLVVGHEIVYLPSVSTLALIRGDWRREVRWSKTAIVFGDPVFDTYDSRISAAGRKMPGNREGVASAADNGGIGRDWQAALGWSGLNRLPASRAEAQAIATYASGVDVVLDFAANRAAVLDGRLASYRIVHFATHGVVDDRHPDVSGIVLSMVNERGEPQDGFLRLHDIYNLTLPSDLVVLSACSTALGRDVQGEGLVGLVRGFMYAGSRQVLASLWKVDDEATRELMKLFYRALLRDRLTPAAALRDAQNHMRGTRGWSHPYYWAGFVLQGDWHTPAPARE